MKYFSKIEGRSLVLFASKVLQEKEDGKYLCECAYGVVQFNDPLHVQTVKSADDQEWSLRSDFSTDVETVVQRMQFTLELP